MDSITLIYPARAHKAYRLAAQTFLELAAKVSSVEVSIMTDDEFTAHDIIDYPRLVVIGNDAVNHLTTRLYMEGHLENTGMRYSSDDYIIRTIPYEKSNILILSGGRPRAALYAVYRYFECFCHCRWFWDGDRICHGTLPFTGVDLTESPHFEYRGIRYFAHRGLHRFQAEHWSFEDWKKEIDWILKKRLNLFMLRIGMDDIFQKAFPEIVLYPDRDKSLPEAGIGYDDRTLFWSLEYRGELRKKILQYAFDCDLMHPEDCGTMTHWYSRTPLDYLEAKKPTLLTGQSTKGYSQATGLAWDIREDENLNNYFKLTESHIKEYGSPKLFHTIGLAERKFYDDKEANLRLKLNVYHRISTYLQENYPNSPLLIASWDQWMYYTPDEVQTLVAQLDPKQAIFFDYTSDTATDNNFTKWGIVGKFPWIFGIFEGYAPNTEIRGNYELINQRLKIAKDDILCKGFVLWPELAHGDTFCGEYLSYHAWEKDVPSIDEMAVKYCHDRYAPQDVDTMESIWQKFMPIVQMKSWSMERSYRGAITTDPSRDLFPNICIFAKFDCDVPHIHGEQLLLAHKLKNNAAEILKELAMISENMSGDELLRRDLFDIARTVLGRFINAGIMQCEKLYAGQADLHLLTAMMNDTERLLETLADLLFLHEDYSLFVSLIRLEMVTDTNPHFEDTLKHNADNLYCRSYVFENTKYLYLPEMKILFDEVKKAAASGTAIDKEQISQRAEVNRRKFHQTPLETMNQGCRPKLFSVLVKSANIIEHMRLD